MNYVRTLFDSVGAMLGADQELPRRYIQSLRDHDPSLAISIEIDSLRESGDEEDEDECYYDDDVNGDGDDDGDNIDDNDGVSLSSYQRKAESFLGRPLEWVTDLLFSMQRFKRGRKQYWIMDISHPLARIIEGSDVLLMVRVEFANHKDMVQVVYQDELVASVVDVLAKRFAANGIALRKPMVMDVVAVAAVAAPAATTVTTTPSTAVVKSEGGKKMD